MALYKTLAAAAGVTFKADSKDKDKSSGSGTAAVAGNASSAVLLPDLLTEYVRSPCRCLPLHCSKFGLRMPQ